MSEGTACMQERKVCAMQVVLCSNHVDQPLGPYQQPPAPDPNKLEAAQQQGKAMGLPPVKAKCKCPALAIQCLQHNTGQLLESR